MEEREKKKKILYIVLGIILLILLFFMIKSCSGDNKNKTNPNAVTEISLATKNMTMTVDDQEQISFTILPANTDETTKWVSSNENVVTVDNKGNVRAIGTGTAIITLVSEKGISDYTVIKVVSKLTEDGVGITASLVESDVSVKVGSTKQLKYTLDPKDTSYSEVMWESSNSLVAKVSSNGEVTGLKSGTATVTVKIVLSDNTVLTDSATITVEDNASLYLTTTIPDIRIGEVVRLSAALSTSEVLLTEGTVQSTNDKTASISNVTTDEGYLTFDVKGIKSGNATLKLTGITSDGKTITLDVPVTVVSFTELFINTGDKELLVGNSFTLYGRVEPSLSGTLETECSTSNSKIASVNSAEPDGEYNGACQITALAKGSSTITIKISGQTKKIKVTVVEQLTVNPETGEPKLIVSLDKVIYSLNEKGSMTVTFVDEKGNSKTLLSNQYTVTTPFDSSSIGDKKVVVNYTYNGDNYNAETTYNVSDEPTDTPGTGEAKITVELDKTTYTLNENAVITVKFIDKNGNSKVLNASEYTIATEFDSSSLGTKKVHVVYPYEEKTLQASVEYTITGSGSGTDTPAIPPGGTSGGGSSGGSGGGGAGGSGGILTYLVPTDDNKQDENNNYVDGLKVKVNPQGDNIEKHKYTVLGVECKKGHEKECEEFYLKNKKNPLKTKIWNKLFEGVMNDPDFPFQMGNMYVANAGEDITLSTSEDDMLAVWLSVITELPKECYDSNLSLKKQKECYERAYKSSQFSGMTSTLEDELGGNIVNAGIPEEGVSSKAGKLTLKLVNNWRKDKNAKWEYTVSVSTNSGYYIQEVTYGNNKEKTTSGVKTSFSARGETTGDKVNATAILATERGILSTLVASIDAPEFDDVKPTCTASYDKSTHKINIIATDEKSGVKKISGGSYVGNAGNVTNCPSNSVCKSYTATRAMLYVFNVEDEAGNIGVCSAKVTETLCYQKAVCDECLSCYKAGCKLPSDQMYMKYEHPEDSDIKYEKAQISGDTYSVGPIEITNFAVYLDFIHPKYGKQLYLFKEIVCWNEYPVGNVMGNMFSFNSNCEICGCENWKLEVGGNDGFKPWFASDFPVASATSTKAIAYWLQAFNDSECKGSVTGKEEKLYPPSSAKGILDNRQNIPRWGNLKEIFQN